MIEVNIELERIYEILRAYAISDDVLRLHMDNAERQASVEAQGVTIETQASRIEELESEIRRRLDADADAEPDDSRPEEDPTG